LDLVFPVKLKPLNADPVTTTTKLISCDGVVLLNAAMAHWCRRTWRVMAIRPDRQQQAFLELDLV
jgi:hypothetical protein